jgi:hypothetical protein
MASRGFWKRLGKEGERRERGTEGRRDGGMEGGTEDGGTEDGGTGTEGREEG